MDACFPAPLETGNIMDVLMSIDQEMRDILTGKDGRKSDEITDEMVEKIDMKMLRETRATVFRAAMDKVDHCLTLVTQACELRTYEITEREEALATKAERMFRNMTPQDMINRRCAKKMSRDIMEILYFVSGQRRKFPASVMKDLAALTVEQEPVGDEMFYTAEYSQIERNECLNIMEQRFVEAACRSLERIMNGEMDEDMCEEDLHKVYGEDRPQGFSEQDETKKDRRVSDDAVMDEDIHDKDCRDELMEGVGLDISGSVLVENDTAIHSTETVIVHERSNNEAHMNAADTASMNRDTDRTSKGLPDTETKMNTHGETTHMKENERHGKNEHIIYIQSERGNKHDPPDERLDTFAEMGLMNAPETPRDGNNTPGHANGKTKGCDYVVIDANEDEPETVKNCGTEGQVDSLERRADRVEPRSRRYIIPHRRQSNKSRRCSGKDSDRKRKKRCVCDSVIELIDRMAQRPLEGVRAAGKRDGQKQRPSNECNQRLRELEEWKESYTRRTRESEDAFVEDIQKLRIQNEQMADELREVRRKIAVMRTQRPSAAAPTDVIPRKAREDEESIGETTMGDRGNRTERGDREASTIRPRAATFGGITRRPRNNNDKGVQGGDKRYSSRDGANGEGRPEDRPLPQRSGQPKGRRGKNTKTTERSEQPSETPLIDWLSTAKPSSGMSSPNDAGACGGGSEAASPPWTDYDSTYEGSGAESDPTTLTPSPRRDNPRQNNTGRRENRDEDAYAIPPSGQVTRKHEETMRQEQSGRPRGYGGARPKTLGKNEPLNTYNDNKSKQTGQSGKPPGNQGQRGGGTGKNGMNYAGAVTKHPWKTQSKKRKIDNISPKQAPRLKGIAVIRTREIYLQGLKVNDYNNLNEIIESVRNYCNENNITAVYIRLIPVKNDCTRTGCKLTVNEYDYDNLMQDDFWPENISAREWKPKIKGDKPEGDEVDRHYSDEEGY